MSDKYEVRNIDLNKLADYVRNNDGLSEEPTLHLLDTIRCLQIDLTTLREANERLKEELEQPACVNCHIKLTEELTALRQNTECLQRYLDKAAFARVTELIAEMSWGVDLPSPMKVVMQKLFGKPETVYAVDSKNYEPVFEAIWQKLRVAPEYQPYVALQQRLAALEQERDKALQRACDECDSENYGWVFNRVEGRGACTCMLEAEPFQILLEVLERIHKAATGELQVAEDDTEGMCWVAQTALNALRSVLPLDYAEGTEARPPWSRNLPNDQALWWWWNEDGPPVPVSVMASGHGDNVRYFASQGQHGWNRAQWVEDMRGFWMRCIEPPLPKPL